jgi:hypothetical protein
MRALADRGLAVCGMFTLVIAGSFALALRQPWWSHVLVFAGIVVLLFGVLAVHGIAGEYRSPPTRGILPLSELDRRQLERIEHDLYADRSRLGRVIRPGDLGGRYRLTMVDALLGIFTGATALVAGVLVRFAWLSVCGFAVMLVTTGWVIRVARRMDAASVTDQ